MICKGYEIEPYKDLRDANLSGADLSVANLSRANLIGVSGFLLLPVQDIRGYSFIHAVLHDKWMVRAGCRFFTIQESREHWGSKFYPDRDRGDDYLCAIDWLERKIAKLEMAA